MSQIDQAIDDYEAFTGMQPGEIAENRLPDEDVVAWRMGRMTAVAYETVRDGEHEDYIHEFETGKGPSIDVALGGREVYLTGGSFGVTERGFEDDKMPAILAINPHKRGTPAKRKANPMAKPKRNSSGQFVARAKPAKRKSNPVTPLKRTAATAARPRIVYEEKRTIRKRKRNPSSRRLAIPFKFGALVVDGATQASGGLLASILVGIIPLPESLKVGPAGAAVKALVGLGLGYGAGILGGPKVAQNIALGAITVAAFELMKQSLPTGVPMGAMYGGPDLGAMVYDQSMGGYVPIDQMGILQNSGQNMGAMTYDNSMGEWEPIDQIQGDDGMGFVTAANTVGDYNGGYVQ